MAIGGCSSTSLVGNDTLRFNATSLKTVTFDVTITHVDGTMDTVSFSDTEEIRTGLHAGDALVFVARAASSGLTESDYTTCTVSASGEAAGTAEVELFVPVGTKIIVRCGSGFVS
jgi:hypothetical protein